MTGKGAAAILRMVCEKHRFESKLPLPCPDPEHGHPAVYYLPELPSRPLLYGAGPDDDSPTFAKRRFRRAMWAMTSSDGDQRVTGWLWKEEGGER